MLLSSDEVPPERGQNSTRLSRNFDFDRGMYSAPLIEQAAANHKSVSTTSKGVPMIDRMLPRSRRPPHAEVQTRESGEDCVIFRRSEE